MKISISIAGLGPLLFVVIAVLLEGCGTTGGSESNAPSDAAARDLSSTYVKDYKIADFDAAHTPAPGADGGSLIFGGIPVRKPASDLPAGMADLLGRWEGFTIGPPVTKDRKLVLVVAEVLRKKATLYGWSGTNLQFPDVVGELHVLAVEGEPPALEWRVVWPGGAQELDRFTYSRERNMLIGVCRSPGGSILATYELSRSKSFLVYKDYAAYLAGKSITVKSYRNEDLRHFGSGYMIYLPPGYETDPGRRWPLLVFLHGNGDRGTNAYVLAKASPFMMIREKGPLPFIIVAPLLNRASRFSSFPDEYMGGVLDEIRNDYRVDESRIYVTGLSMGGEATYRFALSRPGTFAAIAPLSAFLSSFLAGWERIKDLPVRAIHGARDPLFPVARGREPVEALRKAGGQPELIVLPNNDHDTWTDTYSDPAFYDWLLSHTLK